MVDVTWVCGQGCLPHELRCQDTRYQIILGHVIELPLQLICNPLFGHRTNSGSSIIPQNHIKETKCLIYHQKGSILPILVNDVIELLGIIDGWQ